MDQQLKILKDNNLALLKSNNKYSKLMTKQSQLCFNLIYKNIYLVNQFKIQTMKN